MSLLYRDQNGNETHVAGLNGTSGELVPSVSYYQTGHETVPVLESGKYATITTEFTTPMPDTDYVVVVVDDSGGGTGRFITSNVVSSQKTVNGFMVRVFNAGETTTASYSITWQAFKLMTDESRALDEQAIADIQAVIPSTASASNQLVTKSEWNKNRSRNYFNTPIGFTGFAAASTHTMLEMLSALKDKGYIDNGYNNVKLSFQYYGAASFILSDISLPLYTARTLEFTGNYNVSNNTSYVIRIYTRDGAVYIGSSDTGSTITWTKLVTESDLTSSVTSGSTAPVTSGGVYNYLNGYTGAVQKKEASDVWAGQEGTIAISGIRELYKFYIYSSVGDGKHVPQWSEWMITVNTTGGVSATKIASASGNGDTVTISDKTLTYKAHNPYARYSLVSVLT